MGRRHGATSVGRLLREGQDEGEADAPIVRRCDGDGASLEPTAATLAELIRTMGYAAPVASDASAQEAEDATGAT